MRLKAVLPICLILLGGCGPNGDSGQETAVSVTPPEPAEPVTSQEPADPVTALEPYTLEIIFNGLIAYVEEEEQVWALLVDADYDNSAPQNIEEGDLPLCVDHETEPALEGKFPPHRPKMRIRGAAEALNDENLLDLNGRDVRINQTPMGFDQAPDLAHLVKRAKIEQSGAIGRIFSKNLAPAAATAALQDLYRINPLFTADPVGDALKPDSPLAARVLLTSGLIKSSTDERCEKPDLHFTFVSPAKEPLVDSERGIKDPDMESPVELAVEVVAVQKGLTEATTVRFAETGEELNLTPETPGGTLQIWILNQTDRSLRTPDNPCDDPGHFEAFRWFYRLTAGADETEDCAYQLFPQEVTDPLPSGGRRCPNPGFDP